jgi:hypothetical protein
MEHALLAEILISKADGNECDQDMVISGNELQYTWRTQDINAIGENRCQIMVTFADGTVVTSPFFDLYVYSKVINQKTQKSLNEYTALTHQVVMASEYAANAANSATSAAASEKAAQGYAGNADSFATTSKSYATGGTGTRGEDEDVDNAKYFYEQVKTIVKALGGVLLPIETLYFQDLEATALEPGYMYHVIDEFTTDDRFESGSGIKYPAGTNIFVTTSGTLDCFIGDYTSLINMPDADDALSDTSENPVQNKVIYEQIKSIEDSLGALEKKIETMETQLDAVGYPYSRE